jgi:hypothetical protein
MGDEPHGTDLPDLWKLPKSPEPGDKASGAFSDYQYFLEKYERFVRDYLTSGVRDVPEVPIYFETDAFLDFLFHYGDQPSQPFKTEPPRSLSDSDRVREIAAARVRFRNSGEDKTYHREPSETIRRLLKQTHVMHLSQAEIREVARSLNCFGRNGLARSRFIRNNRLSVVRKAWHGLIHGRGSPKQRMESCKSTLYGFGRSAIQELMGYYSPNEYPLRNQNVNAGLRFFGYNVSAK